VGGRRASVTECIKYTHTYTIEVYIYIQIYTYICMHIYTCNYMYIYRYMDVYIYIYTYMYAETSPPARGRLDSADFLNSFLETPRKRAPGGVTRLEFFPRGLGLSPLVSPRTPFFLRVQGGSMSDC